MAIVRADNKRRIVLKEARPGDVFDVEHLGGGVFKAYRMKREASPEPATPPEEAPEEPSED